MLSLKQYRSSATPTMWFMVGFAVGCGRIGYDDISKDGGLALTFDAPPVLIDTGPPLPSDSSMPTEIDAQTSDAGVVIDGAVALTDAGPSMLARGILDPSFGIGGIALSSYPGRTDNASSVVELPSGGYLSLGSSMVGAASTRAFELVRWREDGSLDVSFGDGGFKLFQSVSNGDSAGKVLLALRDGRYAMVGTGFAIGPNPDFLAMITSASGVRDFGYGGGSGYASVDFGSNDAVLHGALANDDSLIVCGYATPISGGGLNWALARFTPSGMLDPTFGSGGRFVYSAPGAIELCTSVLVLSDGSILTAGYKSGRGELMRFTSNGVLDSTFGVGGVASISTLTEIRDAERGPGDTILLGGFNGPFAAITRVNADGSIDTSFGTGGVTSLGVGIFAHRIAIAPSGEIVLGGHTHEGDLSIMRLYSNGLIDNTFGTDGGILIDASMGGTDTMGDVIVTRSGAILAVGSGTASTDSNVNVMVRLL
jgi:uncharacterized delta-60 repeat protein